MKKTFKNFLFTFLLVVIGMSLVACSANGSGATKFEDGKFPTFTAKDFDGNEVTDAVFKENAVTVLNLWFTGCKGCVQEMPELEKLSQEWKNKNVRLIGICSDATSKEYEDIAKNILKEHGVTYTNIIMEKGEKIDKFMSSVVAFPTTILIDRNGNVVGDVITGSIETKEQIDEINKRIDDIIAKDKK